MRVRELRLARGWSQAELAERSGLSVRTIQRVENGANPGLESLRSLAAALEVDIAELRDPGATRRAAPGFTASVLHALRHFDDFHGVAGRAEFWWSALAVTLGLSLAGAIGPQAQAAIGVLVLLPAASLGVRRLRDAGQSPWWMLIALAPVGGLVALAFLWALPTAPEGGRTDEVDGSPADSADPSAARPTA